MTHAAKRWAVPFRTLAIHDPSLRSRLHAVLDRVLDHGQVLLGPEVDAFEQRFAAACGMPHCVGVASGTSALYLALKALGIGPGDQVITTSMSWVATATAIARAGAEPVFVDIKDDLNIDPAAIGPALSPRVKAILPVHYCGRICDMPEIMAFANAKGLPVIEDAAQAFGAQLNGVAAGAFGAASAFSINPMKALRSLGEAGAVVFRDPALRPKLTMLRYLGTEDREHCITPEINHKIDALQAAMIPVFLDALPAEVARRREIARAYVAAFGTLVQCPPMDDPERSVFFDFQVQTDARDALRAHLESRGIEVKIRYARPLSEHTAFKTARRGALPRVTKLVTRILSLPMEPLMTDEQVGIVCSAVREFFAAR